MSAHTPGPWRRDGQPSFTQVAMPDGTRQGRLAVSIFAPGGAHPLMRVGGRTDDPAEVIANADLSVAALDLLCIARRWIALDGGAWNVARHAVEKAELRADTQAVIAKAEGRAP